MASSWPVGPDVRCHEGAASYWLVQAGKTVVLRIGGWPARCGKGIAIGSAVLVPLASLAYRSSKARA